MLSHRFDCARGGDEPETGVVSLLSLGIKFGGIQKLIVQYRRFGLIQIFHRLGGRRGWNHRGSEYLGVESYVLDIPLGRFVLGTKQKRVGIGRKLFGMIDKSSSHGYRIAVGCGPKDHVPRSRSREEIRG